jgi:transcriptional regulator GlxA family with amidase domain
VVSSDDPAMTCRIAFVLFPGFQQLDLAGPMAVFEVARLERPDSYAWLLISISN